MEQLNQLDSVVAGETNFLVFARAPDGPSEVREFGNKQDAIAFATEHAGDYGRHSVAVFARMGLRWSVTLRQRRGRKEQLD